jgi:hypothetical protein
MVITGAVEVNAGTVAGAAAPPPATDDDDDAGPAVKRRLVEAAAPAMPPWDGDLALLVAWCRYAPTPRVAVYAVRR